jgi:hypothetical protein
LRSSGAQNFLFILSYKHFAPPEQKTEPQPNLCVYVSCCGLV